MGCSMVLLGAGMLPHNCDMAGWAQWCPACAHILPGRPSLQGIIGIAMVSACRRLG